MMNQLKNMDGFFPTVFNISEVWRLNSTRAAGYFNLMFFWMYPITFVILIPLTGLCLIEYYFNKIFKK